MLKAAGLDPEKDLTVTFKSASAQIEGQKDRIDDALYISVGPTGPALAELTSTVPSRIVDIPPDIVRKLDADQYDGTGLWFPFTVPGGTFPGISEPAQVMGNVSEIMLGPNVPDSVAYEIVKIIWERKADLEARFAGTREITRELQARRAAFASLNPGVKKYYQDVGWTEIK